MCVDHGDLRNLVMRKSFPCVTHGNLILSILRILFLVQLGNNRYSYYTRTA